MKFKYVWPIIIILFILAGCNADRNQEFIKNGVLDKEAIMESYRENQLDTAQSMAQLYVDSIKSGLDLANDEDAIEMFDLLFNRQTLTVTNLNPEEYMPDSYKCDIVGSGPNGDRVVPLFIIFQEDEPRFLCPLTYYGKQSRRSVETYLKHLLEGDAAKLSQWLSIDGENDYFFNEATRLIEYYSEYDLSKTEIIKFDYDHEQDRFVYSVQDANKENFDVLMSYGDGFSMPDFYSVLDQEVSL